MATALSRYQTVREWLEAGHGRPAFERYDQLSWFIRQHRDELVRSQAYLPGRGARPAFVTAQFGTVVARILKAQASQLSPLEQGKGA